MVFPDDDYTPTLVTVQFSHLEGPDSVEVQVQFPVSGVSPAMLTAYSDAVDAAVAAMVTRLEQDFANPVVPTILYTGQRQA